MKRLLPLITVVFLAGCGGGGGGGASTVALRGAVVWLKTGGAPSPVATVQSGSASTASNATDGSFTLNVGTGTAQVSTIYTPTTGSPVVFSFSFPAISADTDLGDLIVGPEKVTVTGHVLKSVDGLALSGASVKFAGHVATTDATGTYTIPDCAFDSSSLASFLSLSGTAQANGFFPANFSPVSGPIGGTVSIDDVFLSTDSGNTPPDFPATIFGTVSPASFAPGTVVQLLNGATIIRQTTVNSSNAYSFWVGPGTYTIHATNSNGHNALDQSVTLNSTTDTVKRDVALQ